MLHAHAALLLAALASSPTAFVPTSTVPPIGVTVVVGAGVPPTLVTRILSEADAIWRSAGFQFAWQRGAAPTALRLIIDDAAGAAHDDETPLGWVAFVDGVPAPEIHLSYANAMSYLEASRPVVGDTHTMPRLERDTLLGYAMGRALAHELGHYLLASRLHTRKGLMQTHRSAADLFSPDRSHFTIDEAQRALLTARLAPAPANLAASARRATAGR